MPDKPPCKKCGEVHTRCSSHNREKRPCGRWPAKGQKVCRMHGGAAPQAIEAAEERQAEAAADAAATDALSKLWPGLTGQQPVKDPVDQLARAAAAIEHMTDAVGERVNLLNGRVGGGKDLTQLRAEVRLFDRMLDKLLKAAEAMARLGIEERHVQLEQERAEMVTAAFRAALAVIELLPADRDLVIRTFLEKLGVAGRDGEA